MFFKKEFADIIKKISNNYDNQRDFASKSGINRNYLSRYMNLKMDKPPKPAILLRLAEASCGLTTYEDLMRICGYFEQVSGNRLKQAREEQHLSIEEVAKQLNIPVETLVQYENGNNYDADFFIYDKLASLYKTNVAWLTGLVVEKEKTDKDVLTFHATDSSMSPLLDVGDVAYVLRQNTYKSGETILFKLNNNEFVRKVIDFDDYIELQALNPYFPNLKINKSEIKSNNFIIIGKVIKVDLKSAFL